LTTSRAAADSAYPVKLLFAAAWIGFLILFIVHLTTGFMPDNVAFSLLGVDVFGTG
jgi:hypothetical protein